MGPELSPFSQQPELQSKGSNFMNNMVTVHAWQAEGMERAHSLPFANHAKPMEAREPSFVAEPQPAATKATHAAQFTQHIELYRGAVSTVFRAVDDVSHRRVILKCYHKEKMQAKHYHKLDREIRSMQALRGPWVADLYCWFQDMEAVWLVMEWCEGGDLFTCMKLHGGRLDEFYVCTEIIAPLLRVLEKSHAARIMHRDIKPENLFLTKGNRLRLGDFGLAMSWTEELPFSRSGTLDYMAPEVLWNPASTMQEGPAVQMSALDTRGIKPYSEKVDVWAAGVLAYELVVGKPPFEVEDEAQTATLIMYSNSIKFPTMHSALWADFVRAVLVKDPAARPGATQLLEHPWISHHVNSALAQAAAQGRPSSKAQLLQPLPSAHPMAAPLPSRPAVAPSPAMPPAEVTPAARTSTTPNKPDGTPISAPTTPSHGPHVPDPVTASHGPHVPTPVTPSHGPHAPSGYSLPAQFSTPQAVATPPANPHAHGTFKHLPHPMPARAQLVTPRETPCSRYTPSTTLSSPTLDRGTQADNCSNASHTALNDVRTQTLDSMHSRHSTSSTFATAASSSGGGSTASEFAAVAAVAAATALLNPNMNHSPGNVQGVAYSHLTRVVPAASTTQRCGVSSLRVAPPATPPPSRRPAIANPRSVATRLVFPADQASNMETDVGTSEPPPRLRRAPVGEANKELFQAQIARALAEAGVCAGGYASITHGAVIVRTASGKPVLKAEYPSAATLLCKSLETVTSSPHASTDRPPSAKQNSYLPTRGPLQHHLAALQLPKELDSCVGVLASPCAVASPLGPSGAKQRAIQHIRKQSGWQV